VGGRAAPGGNPWGDDFPPEVATLKLVGAAQEHAQHRLGDGFHSIGLAMIVVKDLTVRHSRTKGSLNKRAFSGLLWSSNQHLPLHKYLL
jgi:hypothetical protein